MGWSGFLSCVQHFKFSLKTKSLTPPLQGGFKSELEDYYGRKGFFQGK